MYADAIKESLAVLRLHADAEPMTVTSGLIEVVVSAIDKHKVVNAGTAFDVRRGGGGRGGGAVGSGRSGMPHGIEDQDAASSLMNLTGVALQQHQAQMQMQVPVQVPVQMPVQMPVQVPVQMQQQPQVLQSQPPPQQQMQVQVMQQQVQVQQQVQPQVQVQHMLPAAAAGGGVNRAVLVLEDKIGPQQTK